MAVASPDQRRPKKKIVFHRAAKPQLMNARSKVN